MNRFTCSNYINVSILLPRLQFHMNQTMSSSNSYVNALYKGLYKVFYVILYENCSCKPYNYLNGRIINRSLNFTHILCAPN